MTVQSAKSPADRPMECEWCSNKASYKILVSKYRRYACDNLDHRAKLRRLAQLDGHEHYYVIHGYFTLEQP